MVYLILCNPLENNFEKGVDILVHVCYSIVAAQEQTQTTESGGQPPRGNGINGARHTDKTLQNVRNVIYYW